MTLHVWNFVTILGVSKCCLKGVWWLSGGWLKCVSQVSKGCLEEVLGCLEGIYGMSELYVGCLDQGGILAGNQGTRFPRNLQTHTKFLQHFTQFWHKFDFKVRISCHLKKFFLSHTCMKYFLVTRRNFLALKLINCQRKKFIVTERNLLSRAEIYCHKKKFLVAGRNFLSQEEINFLS